MAHLLSFSGILCLLCLAYLFSENRKAVDWKLVGAGTILQFVLAVLVLKTVPGQMLFVWFNGFVGAVLSYSDAGSTLYSAKSLSTRPSSGL